MKRLIYRLIAVLLLIPVILLTWLTTTESGLLWAYQRALPYLPAELIMSRPEGKLIGPITVKDIEYQHKDAFITADRIIVDWRPLSLLTTSISLSRLHIQSLKIVLPSTDKPDPALKQDLTLPEIHLPWRVVLQDAKITDFRLSQGQQSYGLKQIKLDASSHFSQISIQQLEISDHRFSLSIKGDLKPSHNYPHDLDIRWQAEPPTGAMIKGKGQLKGDIHSSHIKQQLQGPLQLTLDAELKDLLGQLSWQARVDASQFNISQMNKDWPALSGQLKLQANGDLSTATVSGKLEGSYPELGPLNAEFELRRLSDSSLQIDQLKLNAPSHDTQLDASGRWLPGDRGGDIKLALNWQNLSWPMHKPLWFSSARGSATIEGNIDHYRIDLETDRPWPQAPPSHWYARAEGNLDGLTIQSLRITTLDGEAIAVGQLNWSPLLSWKAKINAHNINPARLWPQWPGKLNASLTSNGRYENGKWIADAHINPLKGQLRGYPVSLLGRLSLDGNNLDITQLDLHSGHSRLSLQGQAGDALDLNWSIASNDLAELYPQAKGLLQAQGQVSGPRQTPLVKARVNGSALKLADYEIGAIEGTLAVDLYQWQQIDIQLAAQALKLRDYALQSLDINADTHQLEAKLISDEASVQIQLRGEIDSKGWRGRIERADVQSHKFANWGLKAPATLSLSEKTLSLDTMCWHNHQQASLCTSLQRDNHAWQSQLEMNKTPLLLFSPWLAPDLKLEGVVDASAKLQFKAPDLLTGQAHIELPAGALNYPLLEGDPERWEYRHGKLDVLLDNQELRASAEIAMSNGDRFQGLLSLPGARLLALDKENQPLQASAQLNVHDLGLIEALVPDIQELKGKAELKLSVSGTLGKPKLKGHAQLINGSLRIPRLGLMIDQLNIRGQSQDLAKINFSLDAHSGEGDLSIKGHTTLDSSAGWPSEFSIKGKEFEVSRIPEARVQVTPDLNIKLQHRTIEINGDVHIPIAKLQPKDITTAARVSDDAVIVGGEQPAQQKWSIFTKIRLTLGERVNFYGFGFEGRFGGSLLLEDEPGQLTRATGEINIPEGRYRAYGQRLDVEHGRVLYTGGPLTNPGLDLRAVRHINNITAGIKLIGTLNHPQLELFSIPAMGQTDTLSYLLLGRPMENASGEEGAMMAKAALALGLSGGDRVARVLGERFGLDEMRVESNDSGDQASLVVGRYLSPKLYVSYGVGLMETVNTLSLRYQISDKWQIKAESGGDQGADLLYTIQR
ncbi:MAG: translocation/assembly module TamB domain-containing protein [Gammaproteobacteria bacterium]